MRWRLLHFCIFRWLVQFDAESDIISVRLILQWRLIPSLLTEKLITNVNEWNIHAENGKMENANWCHKHQARSGAIFKWKEKHWSELRPSSTATANSYL